jgi:ribosomal-protein-alanine N-acetyltransferase
MGPPGISVRPAEVADCDVLAEMHSDAFRRGWSGAEFEALLVQPGVRALIAHYRNPSARASRRLRALRWWRTRRRSCRRRGRHCRRRGVARRCLRRPRARSTGKARARIHLEVEDGNSAAIGLYRGMEFRESGTRKAITPRAATRRPARLSWSGNSASPAGEGKRAALTDPTPLTLEDACAEKGMRMTGAAPRHRSRAAEAQPTTRMSRSFTAAPRRSTRTSRSPRFIAR